MNALSILRLWKSDQAELILNLDIDLIRLTDGVRTCRRLPDQQPDFNQEGVMAMIRIAHVSDLHLHCRKQDNKKVLALLEFNEMVFDGQQITVRTV